MKPEAQRIAIAEACGWKQTIFGNWPTQMVRPGFEEGANGSVATCPSYLTDLNAMHEVETILDNRNTRGEYITQLEFVCNDTERKWPLLHATAAQRAEAFLKTLNLWKPIHE